MLLVTHDFGVVAQLCSGSRSCTRGSRSRPVARRSSTGRRTRRCSSPAIRTVRDLAGIGRAIAAHAAAGCRFHPRCPSATMAPPPGLRPWSMRTDTRQQVLHHAAASSQAESRVILVSTASRRFWAAWAASRRRAPVRAVAREPRGPPGRGPDAGNLVAASRRSGARSSASSGGRWGDPPRRQQVVSGLMLRYAPRAPGHQYLHQDAAAALDPRGASEADRGARHRRYRAGGRAPRAVDWVLTAVGAWFPRQASLSARAVGRPGLARYARARARGRRGSSSSTNRPPG